MVGGGQEQARLTAAVDKEGVRSPPGVKLKFFILEMVCGSQSRAFDRLQRPMAAIITYTSLHSFDYIHFSHTLLFTRL